MFFVSLLLNQVVAWMRAQTGTTSLRRGLHGRNPRVFSTRRQSASKAPLLTLLKQGRAFGLGVVLATQNPVDLDYKGLANIGTWFLGRLQTERDKARLLDGLEGAAAGSMDRAETDRLLRRSISVCFSCTTFTNRHRSSSRRDGPSHLGRTALERSDSRLDASYARDQAGESRIAKPRCRGPSSEPQLEPEARVRGNASPPRSPPGVEHTSWGAGAGAGARYRPVVLRGSSGRRQAWDRRGPRRRLCSAVRDRRGGRRLGDGCACRYRNGRFEGRRSGRRKFRGCASGGPAGQEYAAWSKEFGNGCRSPRSSNCSASATSSSPRIQARATGIFRFGSRTRSVARDAAVDALNKKYASKRQQIEEQRRRAAASVDRESAQASQQSSRRDSRWARRFWEHCSAVKRLA